jgi:hypothetical protein
LCLCKNKEKFDKYLKINAIKNKYIIDISKIISDEEVDFNDKTYLKIIIFNKIQQAIDKRKIYTIYLTLIMSFQLKSY